jgi:hypothetical protein
MKKHLKLVAMILCICMAVTILPIGAFAAEGTTKETATQIVVDSSKIDNSVLDGTGGEYQTRGLKKKAVVYALKYGGKLLGSIFDLIGDKKVAKLLKDNSFAIGEFLDSITNAFEARLIDFMIFQLGFPSSAARIIAWAICQVLL